MRGKRKQVHIKINPKKGRRFWQLRRQGGVLCARREIMVVEAVNFDPTSTISISYKSCDVFLSFNTLSLTSAGYKMKEKHRSFHIRN